MFKYEGWKVQCEVNVYPFLLNNAWKTVSLFSYAMYIIEDMNHCLWIIETVFSS